MEDEVKGYQLETCFGSNGCPNRVVFSNAISRRVKEMLEKRRLGSFLKERVTGPLKMHHEFRISISECPNACSRPQIADIGVIGSQMPGVSREPCSQCMACVEICRERAISTQGIGESPAIDWDLCLGCGQCLKVCPTGTLQESEAGYRILVGGKLGRHPRLGNELSGIFREDELVGAVERCLVFYEVHCLKGERLGEILSREGLSLLLEDVTAKR